MVAVKFITIIFTAFPLIYNLDGSEIYDDDQNDEDDSLNCSEGRNPIYDGTDPILYPGLIQMEKRRLISPSPSSEEVWVVDFDHYDNIMVTPDSERYFLTDTGLTEHDQRLSWGSVAAVEDYLLYVANTTVISDERQEFRKIFAHQYLLDRIKRVSVLLRFFSSEEYPSTISKSSIWLLRKLIMHPSVKDLTVKSDGNCDIKCRRVEGNPLIELITCGTFLGKTVKVTCIATLDYVDNSNVVDYGSPNAVDPEFLVDVPNSLKQEFHKKMDWILDRLARRMKSYVEMAFAKNRFRKTPTDLYNKINLQISKIRGGKNLEPSKSVDLIYNSLFDLNVYLNLTNTLFVFDKLAVFSHYLKYIGRFSKWQLDTTKYANFFEPLKDICLRHIGIGASLLHPTNNMFKLEEEVYHLTGNVCKDNVLYIIDGHATVSTIKSGVYDNAHCHFDTVFVLAKQNFTFNENLKLPGKNLVIFSPDWVIVKERTVDLSGNAGKIGEVGSDGGDFFAFGTKFKRSHLLTVVSRGGDGGAGRKAKNVIYRSLSERDGVECIPKHPEEIIERYGASYGAPGGAPGDISFKFIRDRLAEVTVIRDNGKKGKDGEVRNISVRCGSNIVVVPVSSLQYGNFTMKRMQKMKDSQILEIFRKIVRENSHKLPYGVLEFYKDIWTSPLMGQTLDSTLKHFLNVSDRTKDSKEFYDITSQIIHTQIKKCRKMTARERVLLDFALLKIHMENPVERVLPSVIDIDTYLKEVSKNLKKSEIRISYFNRKEAMFRKVIEEAENYMRASLLPSLRETIESTHSYLQDQLSGKASRPDFLDYSFQECLAGNALLRHLAIFFQHVQITLKDFVAPLAEDYVREPNCEILEKKLYFYKDVRNNMTANQMKAMQEFLKLLKAGVKIEKLSPRNLCNDCRQKLHELLKELVPLEPKNNDCQEIAKYLLNHPNCSGCQHREQISQVRMARVRNHRFSSSARFCKRCSCSSCSKCPKCKFRGEFDEIDSGTFFLRRRSQYANATNWFSNRFYSTPVRTMNKLEEARAPSDYLRYGPASMRQPIGDANARGSIETMSEKTGRGDLDRNHLPDNQATWSQCLADVGSLSDVVFNKGTSICDDKTQSECSSILKSLRNMTGRTEEDNASKWVDCVILDKFSERLTFEITKCKGDRETKSICSSSEDHPFNGSGCDPETFSRTNDEIRDHFVKEFSHTATATSGEHKDERDSTPRNLVYALASVDLLLAEGLPITEVSVNAIFRATKSFMRFRDLNKEYEKRVSELHDFSETDVYDLFTAELRMQNERLHLTWKWLARLQKLVPWIKKVVSFIGENLPFGKVIERTLEGIKLISEIVHNIKTVEHYRNLGDYMKSVKNMDEVGGRGVSKFKPVFEKTFIADVYNKAIKISENWMFPMTKSVSQLRDTLGTMKNSTYLLRLRVVAEQIQQHKRTLSLYTGTRSLTSNQNKTFFYQWFPSATLIDDLMSGKPVILVSEILDGKEFNAVTAKNFEMVLRTSLRIPQSELDEALLGRHLEITHSGISYFKFGSRIYRRLTESFTFRHPASNLDRRVTSHNMDFVLSPFTTWIVRMKTTGGKMFPHRLKRKIESITLYGTDRYVLNCADIPDVNEYFLPLNDYRRRNCYYCY